MKKPKISIAVIAKIEADRINRLLKSAEFADEVLVVDSGSIDGTQELCMWILNLDADEERSDSLAEEIQDAKAGKSGLHV